MTRHFTVMAADFPVEELERLRNLFASKKGHRHTSSIPNIKLVLFVLCARQQKRYKLNPDHEVVNESVPQIMKQTGLKKSTVDDVLAFLTWIGLCRTVRKGGGKGKNPTVRFVDFENYVLGRAIVDDGGTGIHVGEQILSAGELSQLDGELPDTPLVKPLHKPLCIPSSFENSIETGFEIEKIQIAYQLEIEAGEYEHCDPDTLPEISVLFNRGTIPQTDRSTSAKTVNPKDECMRKVRDLVSKTEYSSPLFRY